MQFITSGNRIMTENFTVGLFYTITFLNGNILACSCNGIGDNFVSFLCVEPTMQFILDLSTAETVDTIELYGGGAGTMNYNELDNKPSINGETLVGNLTTTDLHIRAVPTIDTTDNNKVLTASYVGGVTSYSWQTVSTGTTNYQDLTNKPEINGHVLSGNQLSSQLGLASAAQGALADTAVQPAALASYQPLIDNSNKLDPALVATDTNNRFATDTQLNQITTNQNNILSIESIYAQYAIKQGKNLINSGSGSGTRWIDISVNLQAGKYQIGFASISSGDTTNDSQIAFFDNTYANTGESIRLEKGTDVSGTVTLTSATTIIRLFADVDSTASLNKSIAYTTAFACPKTVWDIDPTITSY